MDYVRLIESIKKHIEASPSDHTAYVDFLSACRQWETEDFETAMGDIVTAGEKALRNVAQIHSPSKLFESDGNLMMDGLVKGIKDKAKDVKKAIEYVFDYAFDMDAYSTGYSFGQDFANGIVKAIKNTTFPTIKAAVSTSGSNAQIKFNAYANGGYPDVGELFIANEDGPELVGSISNRTAVANNDQIVEAVSSGVYKAVKDAMGNGSRNNITLVVQMDGREVYRQMVNENNRVVRTTGKSPLLV